MDNRPLSLGELVTQAPDVRGYNLAALEYLCTNAGHADVAEVPPTEVLDLIAEVRRLTPVVVAALAWKADPSTARWLSDAIDEYRRLRREAGIDPPVEE